MNPNLPVTTGTTKTEASQTGRNYQTDTSLTKGSIKATLIAYVVVYDQIFSPSTETCLQKWNNKQVAVN